MDNRVEQDFGAGVAIDHVPEGGMLQGRVGGEDVILVHRGGEFFAVGATCTHYGLLMSMKIKRRN